MIEATCRKCGETFIPFDEDDLIHVETEDGEPCDGEGFASTWIREEVDYARGPR
jgi:hypothetical protein